MSYGFAKSPALRPALPSSTSTPVLTTSQQRRPHTVHGTRGRPALQAQGRQFGTAAPEASALPHSLARPAPPERGGQSGSSSKALPPAPTTLPPKAAGRWARDTEVRKRMLAAARAEREREAREQHEASKREANLAWRAGQLKECRKHLDNSLAVNANCDTLHRYRSLVNSREGRHESALSDAGRAVALNPRGAQNFVCQGRSLHDSKKLSEAGAAYLTAMRFGLEGGTRQVGYEGLLSTVRREREYHSRLQASWQKPSPGRGVCRPGSASIFDPRKNFEAARALHSAASRPAQPELRVSQEKGVCLRADWDDPDDGGDEIFLYQLEMSEYRVAWLADKQDFLDEYLPFLVVHEGPQRVHHKDIMGLRSGNSYRLRLCAHNSQGRSEWSEVVEIEIPKGAKGKAGESGVPRSWLTADFSDLIAQAAKKDSTTTAVSFCAGVAAALLPDVAQLRKIFKTFSSLGVGQSSAKQMSLVQWIRLWKDMGLIEGASGILPQPPIGTRLASRTELDLIFQRANMTELQGRGVDPDANKPVDPGELSFEGLEDDDDNDGDGGTAALVMKEFVCALVRVAWICYPLAASVEEKLRNLIEWVLQPGHAAYLEQQEAGFDFEQVLQSRRVAAILSHYEKDLLLIFNSYARADQTGAGSLGSLDSINLAELCFMMKEGKQFDDNLTVTNLTSIFASINSAAEEEEDGDDDEQELVFDEFVLVIACVCDTKVPAEARGDTAFEHTLQSWLHLIFLPKFRTILKDKARGIGKKTL